MDICTLVAIGSPTSGADGGCRATEDPIPHLHPLPHSQPFNSEIRLHSSWESLDERPSGAELKNRNTGSRRFGSRVE